MKKKLKEIKIPSPEKVSGWGMTHFSMSPVLKPETEEEIREIFEFANKNKTKLTFRGGGCSYGDASTNEKGLIIDMSNFNQILNWDKTKGVIKIQSGASLKHLWEFSIEEGFWPPVVSGTMHPSLGGLLSMNVHGKNSFKVGTIGEHVLEFTFMTPNGKILTANRNKNKEIFFSAISGFGMLGAFLTVTLKLKKLNSGKLKVFPKRVENLKEMIDYFEKEEKSSDYLVGWVDSYSKGKSLGRGVIHKAINLSEGEDPDFPENLSLEKQNLPLKFFGIIPKSIMWLFFLPFANYYGLKILNLVKFISSKFEPKEYLQGHAEYAFLLDYVPNWKFIYKPGSMIQYQCFLPKENALEGFTEIFTTCQKRKIVSFLSVFKKHRPDPFLLTHSVDGYSMAMDFPVTKKNKENLWSMIYELDEIVLTSKGKFYLAKDLTLRPEIVQRAFPKTNLEKFKNLKKKLDPKSILESDLYRRIFTQPKK